MKITITMLLALVVAGLSGCESSSSRGGGMTSDVGFRIVVPGFGTEVTQGQTQSIAISLSRGEFFKQDVKLQIKASPGIRVEPSSVVIKASDVPEAQIQITAPQDAALGGYYVFVTGTPDRGEPTSTEFKVRVMAP